jgi:hypothetical protein
MGYSITTPNTHRMPFNMHKVPAKAEIENIIISLREAAREAKNVQTKDYLNIIADNLVTIEKLADQRTR